MLHAIGYFFFLMSQSPLLLRNDSCFFLQSAREKGMANVYVTACSQADVSRAGESPHPLKQRKSGDHQMIIKWLLTVSLK